MNVTAGVAKEMALSVWNGQKIEAVLSDMDYYATNTVYKSELVKFPSDVDTTHYLLHFDAMTSTEPAFDFFTVYAGNTTGEILYRRSGPADTWPDVVVSYETYNIYIYLSLFTILHRFLGYESHRLLQQPQREAYR